eukprot:g17866.t1
MLLCSIIFQAGRVYELRGGRDGAGRKSIERLRKKELGLTIKKPSVTNPRKYTIQNIQRMYEYLDYIPTVPQRHRKFVDEAAYSERDLSAKKGCKSRPASITHPKGGALLSIRQGTNKATHFADAILGAVHAMHLLAGDRLILDNAGIHRAKKVIPALRVILSAVGVELVYLPKYSPEYNPAEFAFNWTKSNLKQNVTGESFLARIANAFAEEVTLERMTNAYEHCMP